MNQTELGWIAGYLEGEGSFRLTSKGGIAAKVASTDGDVVKRAAMLMGSKRVHGPYLYPSQRLSKKPYYSCETYGAGCVVLMRSILPLMGERRKAKIEALLRDYRPTRRSDGVVSCHPDRPYKALGLCGACYQRLKKYRKTKGSV